MPDQSNPYAFGEDEDDDIFSHIESHKNANPDKVNDVINGMDLPADMPDSVRNKLKEFLMTLPEDALDKIQIIAERLDSNGDNFLSKFAHFMEVVESLNYNGGLIRAIAEVLNDITSGEVERRWKLYRSEQILIAQHQALKILNGMMEQLSQSDMPGKKEMYSLLENVVQSVLSRIHEVAETYREYAAKESFAVDEKLIVGGVYTDGLLPDYVKACIVHAFQADLMVVKSSRRI